MIKYKLICKECNNIFDSRKLNNLWKSLAKENKRLQKRRVLKLRSFPG